MSEQERGNPWTPGRWRVNRERLHLPDARPPKRGGPARIDAVIPNLMRKLGLHEQHWLSVLDQEWSTIVGDAVAKHTRPGRFVRHRLIVFVDSSVWLNELARYGRSQVLAKLQERFGKERIRDLSLQLDPDGPAAAGGTTPQP